MAYAVTGLTELTEVARARRMVSNAGTALHRKAVHMTAPDVWIAKDDGSDIVRAVAIAAVGRDYNGNIHARLAGGDQAAVTLVQDHGHDHGRTPGDFHRQLVKVIAELSDTAESVMIRPVHDPEHGWRWLTERL